MSDDLEMIESEMLDLLQQVGNIAGMNGPATYHYARLVKEYGKPVSELTVAELLELKASLDEHYRVVYSGVQVL